jgi:hypothetical protein
MKMKAIPFFEASGNTERHGATCQNTRILNNTVAVIFFCFGLFTVYNNSLYFVVLCCLYQYLYLGLFIM